MRSAVLLVMALSLALAPACGGGAVSVLHSSGRPTGDGAAKLTVKNVSGKAIAQLYVAKTEDVDKARAAHVSPGTEADQALWGEDQLGNASLVDGSTWAGLSLAPGHYDVLLIASDRREQLVKNLNVQAGGRYVLEINDRWVQGRD